MFLSVLTSHISQAIESPTVSSSITKYERYAYAPLPDQHSIRLLEILPGDSPEIRCSLQVANLRINPSYDALSYTWGDPRAPLFHSIAPEQYRRQHCIICDDRTIHVTANLFHALQRLRQLQHRGSPEGPAPLPKRIWIDAVCINQQDPAERSSQVGLMDEIYKGAQLVIAWLGKKDRYTERALRLIAQLSESPLDRTERHQALHLSYPDIKPEDWEALVAFFRRSYFRRAWIVQEAVLAKGMIFFWGSSEISWETVLKCSQFISSTKTWRRLEIFTSYFASLSDRMARRTITPTGITIATFSSLKTMARGYVGSTLPWHVLVTPINLGRGFLATNQQDHYYSVLGVIKNLIKEGSVTDLVQSSLDRLPIPDYTKPVEKVFTEFAEWQLEICQNLFLLAMVEDRTYRSPSLLDTLPSWVPDQSVPLQPWPLHLEASPHWDPAGPGSSGIGVPIEGGILIIRGGLFDTIKGVADPFDNTGSPSNWISILNLVKPLLNTPYPVSGAAYAGVLWRTTIADSVKSSGNEPRQSPADPLLAQAFNEWLISRVSFFEGFPADSNHFHAESYSKVQRMLLLGVWDQIRADPGAFASVTTEDASNDEECRELYLYDNHERQIFNPKTPPSDELTRKCRAFLATLIEVSLADTSDTFFNPEQISGTLRILGGPDKEERMRLLNRKDAFIAASKAIIESRRLFLTDRNYLGLGSESAQIGDQVWIISGPSTPFILRPMQNGRYKLIGEAYVHGIMKGEAAEAGSIQFGDIELE